MKKLIIQEIINPKMLLDLGFYRKDKELDNTWCHNELLVRNMILRYFDGAYHFEVIGTIQGIGSMNTMDELIDGFEFVTSGEKLVK